MFAEVVNQLLKIIQYFFLLYCTEGNVHVLIDGYTSAEMDSIRIYSTHKYKRLLQV